MLARLSILPKLSSHGRRPGGAAAEGRRGAASASARAGWAVFGATLALAAALVAPLPAQEPEPAEARVIVVPVKGMIDDVTAYQIQSSLREARSRGIARIVLEIDTPGGLVESSAEIESALRSLSRAEVQVIAFVEHKAQSAGAYVALACAEIYMAPGASIGAMVPVLAGPGGIQAIGDEEVRAKIVAALRGDVRAMVERRGNARPGLTLLAEAMVDPDLEVFEVSWLDAGGIETSEIVDARGLAKLREQGVEITEERAFPTRPLVLSAGEAVRVGLSSGTIGSVRELVREELMVPIESIVRRDVSWSEEAVAFLNSMKPVLFVLGFLFLMLELKTPGFAVPGAIGVALLALAMFSSYLVGLAEWQEVLLFFAGIALVGVEVFVMPGMLVFGFAGLLCIVMGLLLSQQSFFIPETAAQHDILLANLVNMLLLTLAVIVGAIALWRLLPHVPIANRVLLPPPNRPMSGGQVLGGAAARSADLVGKRGVAVTDLRPTGSVEIDGEWHDAVTDGSYVGKGATVAVRGVEYNQLLVELEAGGAEARGEVNFGTLMLIWIVGLCLVIAEVFFPSFGVLSVLAALAFVAAIFFAYTQDTVMGHVFLVLSAVGAPLAALGALRVLPHTPFGGWLMLKGPRREDVAGSGVEPGLQRYAGQRGHALTALRPAGIARIDGARVDVVTRGELVDKDQPVVVIEVEGNRVVVAPVRDAEPTSAASGPSE